MTTQCSEEKIQGDMINFCSFYCATFLIYNRNMNSLGKMVTSNLQKNDKKLVEIIDKPSKKMYRLLSFEGLVPLWILHLT